MRIILLSAALAVLATPSLAGGMGAKDHAPIGVAADRLHHSGEFMFSYRFMRMEMAGSRVGADAFSADEIVTTIPNRFFGAPGQPPTLRVAPTEMTMTMHHLGVMYAPSDRVTLMAMGALIGNRMDHLTYQGGIGDTVLGGFETTTFGVGDTNLSALVGLHDSESGGARHRLHSRIGVSLPTGDTTKTGEILTPMGATPTVRLPYPMQPGSGTVDMIAGLTYYGVSDRFAWGAQYTGTFRTGSNDAGYSLGDRQDATAWAQWGPIAPLAFSVRAAFRYQGRIEGADPQIIAPVQTANPDFQGGERIDIGLGVTIAGNHHGALAGNRIGIEVLLPVYQDLNGPQLEADWTLTVGVQKTF